MSKDLMTLKLTPFFRVNILFFPILAASILGGYLPAFALSYLCALIHELTHITVALCLGTKISYMEILPFGICARLKCDIIKNPAHEIVIALSGPVFNLLAAACARLILHNSNSNDELFSYFFYCNIAMALVNFIPALPLDGGRVLRAALTMRSGSVYAYRVTVKVSRIPIFLLLLTSTYLLLTRRFNFSFILIGVFLLSNLCTEQKNISKMALREMLTFEDKLKSTDMNRTTVITAYQTTPARKILKHLSYSSYNIIHVVDDKLRVLKTLTEGQLIRALTDQGIRVTLGDIHA